MTEDQKAQQSRNIIAELRLRISGNTELKDSNVRMAALDALDDYVEDLTPQEVINAYESGDLDVSKFIAEGYTKTAISEAREAAINEATKDHKNRSFGGR